MYISLPQPFLKLLPILLAATIVLIYCGIRSVQKWRSVVNVYDVDHIDQEFVAVDASVQQQFREYVAKYNRRYDGEEYVRRQRYFEDSLKEISRLNELQDTAVFSINKFSDWSSEEKNGLFMKVPAICKKLHIDNCDKVKLKSEGMVNYTDLSEDIPEKVDWRDKGVLGPILDQKRCRGCWAFSIVGAMETMWAIQGNSLNSLSVQEMIDCTPGNRRCDGGNIVTALNYYCTLNQPVVAAGQYPLKLVNEPCEAFSAGGRRVASFINDCDVDENLILKLAAKGPVVAVVNARPWLFYNNGVITKECVGDKIYMIHVIQIVGYDRTADVPYYIIKNNWGDDFGEDGYIRIALNQNMCGITNNVAVLTVK